MTEQDKQDIVDAVTAAMSAHAHPVLHMDNPEKHADDHRFIASLLQRERRRVERWEAVRKQVMGWGVVVLLSGIGAAVYRAVFDSLHRGGQ